MKGIFTCSHLPTYRTALSIIQNINLSLQKNWLVTEAKTVQFRWEVFNIFNHPNFQLMDRNFNETGGGYLTTVAAVGAGGARIMQFGLKFLF